MNDNYIKEKLKKIEDKHNQNNGLLNDIRTLIDFNPSSEVIGSLLRAFINEISKEALMSRDLPAELGLSKDICRLGDNDYEIELRISQNGYLFILPDLLPKKNTDNGAEINFVKYNYASAFEKLERKYSFRKFNSRVWIVITNYFEDEVAMIDNDNVYVKPIIDTIASYLLVDDNPLWADLCIKGRLGKYNHTEIEVFLA